MIKHSRLLNKWKLVQWLGAFFVTSALGLALYNQPTIATTIPSKLGSKISAAQMKASQLTAKVNGLRILHGDEFVIPNDGSNTSPSKLPKAILTTNNGSYEKELTNPASLNIVNGSYDKPVMVKDEPSVKVHNTDEVSSVNDNKVSEEVARSLDNNKTTSVIVQLNGLGSPFDKRDNSLKRWYKKHKYNSKSSDVKDDISGHGAVTSDLYIASSVAANIDKDALAKLKQNPNVKKIEPNQHMKLLLDDSVPQINGDYAWTQEDSDGNQLTGKNMRIAIIDSGVDYTHPDLGGCFGLSCKVIGGYDFVNNDPDPMDDMGHGTHVASIAAGKGWLNGVAPDAKILAYKVCSSDNICLESDIIKGIQKSVDPNGDSDSSDHVDVVNMSLGGPGTPDDATNTAVSNAIASGVVFAIAAGNSGPNAGTIGSPGINKDAITVAAACKPSDIGNPLCPGPIANFSSEGPFTWMGQDYYKPDISAPGALICAARHSDIGSGCQGNSTYALLSGTSMATPHIAGAIALIRQAHPELTPQQVKDLIKSSATSLGVSYDAQGAGLINLKKALNISEKASITPHIFNLSTDPAVQTSVLSKSISVQSQDETVSALDLSIAGTFPDGFTVGTSKPSLNVANSGSDSFDLNISVDNDLVPTGNYQGFIQYRQSGQLINSSVFDVFVVPTISVQYDNIAMYFGAVDPSVTQWTSSQLPLTVTNLRQDISQTVTFGLSAFPTGVTANVSADSYTVSPSQSQQFKATVSVNNDQVQNNDYWGRFDVHAGPSRWSINANLTKFYTIKLNTSGVAPDRIIVFSHSAGILMDISSNVDFIPANPSLYTSYLDCDVIVLYKEFSGPYFVIKENIPFILGKAELNTAKSDATNSLTLEGYDKNNNLQTKFGSGYYSLSYQGEEFMGWANTPFSSQTMSAIVHINSASSSYSLKTLYRTASGDAKSGDLYYFSGAYDDLSASQKITVSQNDLNAITFKPGTSKPKDTEQIMYTGIKTAEGVMVRYQDIDWNDLYSHKPLWSQTIWSNQTDPFYLENFRLYFQQLIYDNHTDTRLSVTPLVDIFDKTREFDYEPGYEQSIPPLTGNTVSSNTGRPFFWFPTVRGTGLIYRPTFIDQDYSPIIFGKQSDSYHIVYSVTFCSGGGEARALNADPFNDVGSSGALFSGINVGDICQIDFGGIPSVTTLYDDGTTSEVQLQNTLNFTIGTDKNWKSLPQLSSLQFLSDGVVNNSYLNNSTNRIDFKVSKVAGTDLSSVGLSYSTDNLNYTPLSLSSGDSGFFSDMSNNIAQQIISYKINVVDSLENSFTYKFQMPVRDNVPVDTTLPTISLNTPTKTGTTYTFTGTGEDNIALDHLEYYSNGSLIGTSATSPIQFTWDTNNIKNGQYSVSARAVDIFGNSQDSSAVSVDVKNSHTAPTGKLTINSSRPSAVKVVPLAINASSVEGRPIFMRFSNNGTAWSDWQDYQASIDWDVTNTNTGGNTQEGTKTVYIQLKDSLDTTSQNITSQVIYDLTPPATDAGTNKDRYPKRSILQSPSVSDNLSGVASYVWSKISGPGVVTFGSPTSKDTTISANEPGSYILRLTTTDNAGNSTTDDMTLRVHKNGDINNDVKINNDDFTLLMFNWGTPGNAMADLDGSGRTDNNDFTLLMFNWAP